MTDQSHEQQLAYLQGRALACRTAFNYIIDVYFQDTPTVKFVHTTSLIEELTAFLNEKLTMLISDGESDSEPSPAFVSGFQEELRELADYARIPH